MGYPAPSREVVEKTATLEGVAPTDLAPPNYDVLNDVIDPEALDALCRSNDRTPVPTPIEVAFVFNGYRVTVRNDGSVTVRDRPISGRTR
ncbi:HalOD1 output domain-containing protein [Halomontanus rarus]|uniref:HalOD1 output domain-containing protein n=1 Tax=Halomontanus rarus TaxID=3034020 RepID=UPI0023E757EB|nr:HalOD1 output domain-containing protein [Halovivax sp. TS33]